MNNNGSKILATVSIIFALVFAGTTIWSYSKYSTEQDNTATEVAAAVSKTKTDTTAELEAELDEKLKSPYAVYEVFDKTTGIKVSYPNSWSVYAEDQPDTETTDLASVTFDIGTVRPRTADSRYALRIRLVDELYEDSIKSFDERIEAGTVIPTNITLDKYPDVQAIRFDGELGTNINGSFVIVQIRRQSLRIWTESAEYLDDFEQILAALEFAP